MPSELQARRDDTRGGHSGVHGGERALAVGSVSSVVQAGVMEVDVKGSDVHLRVRPGCWPGSPAPPVFFPSLVS